MQPLPPLSSPDHDVFSRLGLRGVMDWRNPWITDAFSKAIEIVVVKPFVTTGAATVFLFFLLCGNILLSA